MPDFAALLIPDPENVEDLVERLLQWRLHQEQWRARFQPFGERLRSRTWRDTAADFVSIVEKELHAKATGLSRLVGNLNS